MGQESRHNLVGSSAWHRMRLQSRCHSAGLSGGFIWGEFISKLLKVVGRTYFLVALGLRVLGFGLLSAECFPSSWGL